MFALLTLDDDDLSKIRRSMNFYSVILLGIWWTGASLDFSKFGFLTTSIPIDNWQLKAIITVILLYLAIRQHYIYPWTLEAVTIEIEKENKNFRGTISTLISAFEDFKTKLSESSSINTEDFNATNERWKKLIEELNDAKEGIKNARSNLYDSISLIEFPNDDNGTRRHLDSELTKLSDNWMKTADKWDGAFQVISRWNADEIIQSLQQYSAMQVSDSAKNAMGTIVQVVPEMHSALVSRRKDIRYFGLHFPRAMAVVTLCVVWPNDIISILSKLCS